MSQTQVETSTVKIPQYTQALETTHELDWADLSTLDLSKFDSPGGKEELASQLQKAIEQIGTQTQTQTPNLSLPTSDPTDFSRFLLCHKLWPHTR